MLEFLHRLSPENALAVLKKDHDTVKDLFEQFEEARNLKEKVKIAKEAIEELKIHATIEEEIFYPAVRRKMDDKDLLNEANEEHHVAKLLIAELCQMDTKDEYFEAKFTVLSENIRHHIREEEGEMFPEVRSLDLDLEALGHTMLDMKDQLKRDGVPASDEDKMIAKWGMKDDSPAKNQRKHSAKRPAKRTTGANKHPAPKKNKAASQAARGKVARGKHAHA